ncbi:Uncharacterised protein [uncultured archaeon]|nr:Uncharacterised protein [uncultured archaeon]
MKEVDSNIEKLKRGDAKSLDMIMKMRAIREHYLESYEEIADFRKKIQPWIERGFVSKNFEVNPDSPLEQEFCYSLTSLGKQYYQDLNPIHEESDSCQE